MATRNRQGTIERHIVGQTHCRVAVQQSAAGSSQCTAPQRCIAANHKRAAIQGCASGEPVDSVQHQGACIMLGKGIGAVNRYIHGCSDVTFNTHIGVAQSTIQIK